MIDLLQEEKAINYESLKRLNAMDKREARAEAEAGAAQ
jgi:hypothetical protein